MTAVDQAATGEDENEWVALLNKLASRWRKKRVTGVLGAVLSKALFDRDVAMYVPFVARDLQGTFGIVRCKLARQEEKEGAQQQTKGSIVEWREEERDRAGEGGGESIVGSSSLVHEVCGGGRGLPSQDDYAVIWFSSSPTPSSIAQRIPTRGDSLNLTLLRQQSL
ncbi:MAG: hypothetical protein Q9159_001621 [Coniocarpon cinnabarinum]